MQIALFTIESELIPIIKMPVYRNQYKSNQIEYTMHILNRNKCEVELS